MEKIKFYGLLDFYPRKEQIKNEFNLLSLDEVYIYKMYVYSLPFEDDCVKDLIWEYLNGWQEAVFDLAKKYRLKKEINDKRQQKYREEAKIESQHNVEVG